MATSVIRQTDNPPPLSLLHRHRGNYKVHVYGFDERYYAEALLDILVFRMSCDMPQVWIPDNQTSFLKLDAVPTIWKSKSFSKQAMSSINCNVSTPT